MFALSVVVVLASVVVVQFLFAPLTLLVGGTGGLFNAITIAEPGRVAKTFPSFFRELGRIASVD